MTADHRFRLICQYIPGEQNTGQNQKEEKERTLRCHCSKVFNARGPMTDLSRQQRFSRNVKDNDMRGIGGHAFRHKGYNFPSHEQMDKFKKHGLPYDIDKKMRELIILLNESGYKTGGSCSGHSKEDRGFITILPDRSDPFLYEVKQNHPDKLSSLINGINHFGGFSQKPINPDKIKKAIKKYLNVTRVVYSPPKLKGRAGGMQIYHSFTFPAVSDGWG
jgi:hypothetical protein